MHGAATIFQRVCCQTRRSPGGEREAQVAAPPFGAVADPALQAPPRLLALPQLLRQPHQVAPDARLPAGRPFLTSAPGSLSNRSKTSLQIQF